MVTPMTRLLALLSLCVVPLLAGCPICDPVAEVVDDFAERCADGPCRWTADAGAISQVPTFHESELGMRLEPATTATRSFRPTSFGSRAPEALEVTALCDPGTMLRVSVAGTDATVAADGGTVTGSFRRSVIVNEPDTELFQVYRTTFSWPPGAVVETAEVETMGAGGCVVDDIVLTSQPGC
jgi:hypothetical protein